MSLFEVQRLLDAWPSLQDSHIIRNLFSKPDAVRNVWLIPGHVFILDEHDLHVLTQTSFSDAGSNGHFQIDIASDIVNILRIQPNTVLLVETSGQIQVLEYYVDTCHWELTVKTNLLLTGKGQIVSSVHLEQNQLLYCVKEEGSDDWNHSVYLLQFHIDKESLQLTSHTQLLYHCPCLCLYPCELGVWLIPKSGELAPSNLILYWNRQDSLVQPYIWGQSDECNIKIDLKDFKLICRQTANIWSRVNNIPSLVSFTVHPILNDLMCLTDNGTVYFIFQKNGTCVKKEFVQLSDFIQRYPTPKKWFDSQSVSLLQIFVLHTYFGICRRGELRLYDTNTGEFIWECDDLDHPTTKLIVPSIPLPILPVSLWGQSGIHFLRCKRIADHAAMFVDSLFPITTNADETTPGDYLDNAEIIAAELCHLWSMDMLASQYTLKMAYTLLKDYSISPNKQPIPPKLLELLTKLSVQNPIFCVTLLSQYPSYRNVLLKQLTTFVDNFYHNDSDSLKTSLNFQTAPLLKQYLELSQQYEDLLHTPRPIVNILPSVRESVKELLNFSYQTTLSRELIVKLRTDLLTYCSFDPVDTLLGIKDFMKIPTTFADALQSFSKKSTAEFETHNWRSILASDVAEKIPQTSLKSTNPTNNLPLFELTVQLLYSHEPQDLIQFVTFIYQIRDHQTTSDSTYARQCHKGYFYQRALDIIPIPSATDQVHSYCQIMLMSGSPCAEMKALQILLDYQLWSDAINMLHQVYSEVTPSVQCALFHSMLTGLSKAGVLHQHISSVWPLLPKTFSIHNFIDVLKLSSNQKPDQIYTESSEELQLKQVIPYILQLLSQHKLNTN